MKNLFQHIVWIICAFWLGFTTCGGRETVLHTMPQETQPTIVFLGDSLTAGYGLRPEQSYPAIIQKKIQAVGLPHIVMNGGVSGDTTADGLARLSFYLRPQLNVQHFVIFLGANDAMRAIPLSQVRHNLREIIRRVKEKKIPHVYLVELRAFESMYSPYRSELAQLYREVASQERVILLPFFLEGVADVPQLNMADGIHPTAEGMALVAENAWRALQPYLQAR